MYASLDECWGNPYGLSRRSSLNYYWAGWEDWKQIGTVLIRLSGKIGSKSGQFLLG